MQQFIVSTDCRKIFVAVISVLIFILGVPGTEIVAQNVLDHLSQGDEFAAQFDHQKALEEYKKAFDADTSNCTALWKIAEAYVNLGEEADEKVKRQYFYLAERWAQKAVALCPHTANAHFMLAVATGRVALYEGGKAKIERSKEVKTLAEKTLELDPDHHGAYHVLGRWHFELASLSWFLKTAAKIIYGGVPPGASYEKAVANLKKAIEISPQWINHHKQLGLVYMKMAKWDRARKEFQRVLELPVADHQDEAHKEDCRKLLEEIEDK
ncbi:hypothetical protein GWO43_31445 [candidate division KSB1 bacterium]|nr:hypothetical protein [candidate division KSB1 bacterium]NIR73425.1 hypothetical protein [candidate division KSB1 bacterium]NIS28416.1 hypothetical protein [candidate division KSB1 bacterium]NIT75296.1 hypothetical protein [candidate division KSB1 bacterium]NIU29144.1 hypothetical protein [candidate division KSB1 bacterium]